MTVPSGTPLETFIKFVTNHLLNILETRSINDWATVRAAFRSSAKIKGSISHELIFYSSFAFTVRATCLFLQYGPFYDLFPVRPQSIVEKLFAFVVISQQVAKGPARLVAKAIMDTLCISRDARYTIFKIKWKRTELLFPQ